MNLLRIGIGLGVIAWWLGAAPGAGAQSAATRSVPNPQTPPPPPPPAAVASATNAATPVPTATPAPVPAPAPAAAHPEVSWRELSSALSDHTRNVTDQERLYREFLQRDTEAHVAFIDHQEELHRNFWETWYDRLEKGLGAVVFCVLGLMAWLGFKAWKDVAKIIEKQFESRIEPAVDKKLAHFETELADHVASAQGAIEARNAQLDSRSEDLEKRFVTVIERIDPVADLASAVSFAAVILNQDGEDAKFNAQREVAIREIMECRVHFPGHRRLAIYLGRLLQGLGQLESARTVLQEEIEKRVALERHQGKYAEDHAALLFNRACYANLLARTSQSPLREILEDEAWSDLKKAVKLHPPNLDEARQDEDFTGLEREGVRKFDDLKE